MLGLTYFYRSEALVTYARPALVHAIDLLHSFYGGLLLRPITALDGLGVAYRCFWLCNVSCNAQVL